MLRQSNSAVEEPDLSISVFEERFKWLEKLLNIQTEHNQKLGVELDQIRVTVEHDRQKYSWDMERMMHGMKLSESVMQASQE